MNWWNRLFNSDQNNGKPEVQKRVTSSGLSYSDLVAELSKIHPTIITPENALQVAAVYGCIKVIKDTFVALSRNYYDKKGEDRIKVLNDPTLPLLKMPGKQIPWSAFIQIGLDQKFIYGNSVWVIERDQYGTAIALHFRKNGEIIPRYYNGDFWVSDRVTGRELDVRDIFHFKDLNGSTPYWGASRLEMHGKTIGKIAATDDLQNRLATSGLQLGGVVSYPKDVEVDEAVLLRQEQNFHRNHQGKENAGKYAFFQGGPTVTQFQPAMTLSDAQVIQATHLSIEDICRIFHMPPTKIYHLIKPSFNSYEHLQIDFMSGAILPDAKAFEEEWNWKILNMSPTREMKFELDSLLRADTMATIQSLKEAISTGLLSINEGRALLNRNAINNGDKHFYPSNNLTPLEDLGKKIKPNE